MWGKEERRIISFLTSSSGNLEMLEALEKLGRADIKKWMEESGTEDESIFRKRLEELMNYGLVSKTVEEDEIKKEYYFLTQKGESILSFIKSTKKKLRKTGVR
ncbi:MAG: hypothetical protein H5T47_06190 [Archaeoglobi archaeon]|nr:hypothetical protein [Candidatus Mnemosynella bozhongmuii]